jgi:hypothetical protein
MGDFQAKPVLVLASIILTIREYRKIFYSKTSPQKKAGFRNGSAFFVLDL